MPEQMPRPYEGGHPYVFACYAHADRDTVLPIIRALVDEGFRVWWDDGIKAGTHYPTYVADHVKACSLFVMFVSRASLDSDWCNNEVHYALDHGRQALPIYLQDVELTSGLEIRIGRLQSLYWWQYDSSDSFYKRLFQAHSLDCCLTDEGEKRRQSRSLLVQRARRTLDANECGREALEGALVSLRTLSKSLPRKDEDVELLMREFEARLAREGNEDVQPSVPAGPAADAMGRGAKSRRAGDDVRDVLATGGSGAEPSEAFRNSDSASRLFEEFQKNLERQREGRGVDGKTSRGKSGNRKPTGVRPTERKERRLVDRRKHQRPAIVWVAVAVAAFLMVAAIVFGASQSFGGPGQTAQPKPSNIVAANDAGKVPTNVNVSRDAFVDGVDVKSALYDYYWDELKRLAVAIAKASDDDWLVIAKTYNLVNAEGRLQGEEKTFTLNDGTKTSVRILGFRHDGLKDGGKAGITFEFADAIVTHQMNPKSTNAGGWEKSEMRDWLNSVFMSLLPDDLQSRIEAVEKQTNNVGRVESEGDASAVTSTTDRLWLLSLNEVYGYNWDVYGVEGTQYRLYTDLDESTYYYELRAKRGARSLWWLRSPYAFGSHGFLSVRPDGGWYAAYANSDWGVSPGFCL